MQLKGFHWLSHHGVHKPLITMLYKYGIRTHDFRGIFNFSLL